MVSCTPYSLKMQKWKSISAGDLCFSSAFSCNNSSRCIGFVVHLATFWLATAWFVFSRRASTRPDTVRGRVPLYWARGVSRCTSLCDAFTTSARGLHENDHHHREFLPKFAP